MYLFLECVILADKLGGYINGSFSNVLNFMVFILKNQKTKCPPKYETARYDNSISISRSVVV